MMLINYTMILFLVVIITSLICGVININIIKLQFFNLILYANIKFVVK